MQTLFSLAARYMSIRALLLLSFTILTGYQALYANNQDSTKVKRNIIRWNLTPMFVVGPKSLVLGYERITRPGQSFSINLGYLETSPFTNSEGDVIEIFDESNKGGIDISIDYRFYFKKRNKYPAPDGLYWGPYVSYYSVWQDASIRILDVNTVKNTAFYNSRFNMYNIGLQLGYQFIIKKRFSIDLMLMGPSYSYYDFNMNLRFETDINEDDPFYQDLFEKIKDYSPFLSNFIKDQKFEANGRLKFGYYGFRYGVQLGYHF